MVILVGHTQAQHMVKIQPMKMAAAEALWESQNPAAMSLFTIVDEKNRRDVFAIKIPHLLSILAYNSLHGEVKGIKNIQEEEVAKYGPGNYVPPVTLSYWTFRLMVGAGFVMLILLIYALVKVLKRQYGIKTFFLKFMIWAIALPVIANTTGWIFTEIARQPWIVFGLLKTADAISPSVTGGEVLFSLIMFTSIYGALMAVDIYLLKKFAVAGMPDLANQDE
jgi:cytochrome d ubiquinol oxidase subunit I